MSKQSLESHYDEIRYERWLASHDSLQFPSRYTARPCHVDIDEAVPIVVRTMVQMLRAFGEDNCSALKLDDSFGRGFWEPTVSWE